MTTDTPSKEPFTPTVEDLTTWAVLYLTRDTGLREPEFTRAHEVVERGIAAIRAAAQPTESAVVEAVRLAQQEDGGYGMTRGAAERVWRYLTQPADPREGEVRRDVECCPGKTCTTTVVRRAGMWVRTSNGEVWHDPEEQA